MPERNTSKVAIVGAGSVGSTIAYACLMFPASRTPLAVLRRDHHVVASIWSRMSLALPIIASKPSPPSTESA